MGEAALPLMVRAAPSDVSRPPWAGGLTVVLGVLIASSALYPALAAGFALLAIIVLGIPHGALDNEVARTALRPRFGRLWWPVFALPYLALSAAVLAAWHSVPLLALVAFLALSVLHFGAEDARAGSLVEKLVRGGLPIAMPSLAHPGATAAVLGTVAGVSFERLPSWLALASAAWLMVALVWAIGLLWLRRGDTLRLPALLALVFIVVPPLTAFAIYFVCVHAPAHTEALIADGHRAPRVRGRLSAIVLALPLTTATILLGGALWPFYAGPWQTRLMSLTIQGLAALTLPHMLLDAGFERLRILARPYASIEALGTASTRNAAANSARV